MLDELGDVLFQVHFLALLLEERGAGDLAAVAEGCREKLIRRHPHVFGDAEAESAGQVLRNWDRIKQEQEGRGGAREPFADVPENLPALLYARKLQRRAGSAGRLEEGDPADGARALRESAMISPACSNRARAARRRPTPPSASGSMRRWARCCSPPSRSPGASVQILSWRCARQRTGSAS